MMMIRRWTSPRAILGRHDRYASTQIPTRQLHQLRISNHNPHFPVVQHPVRCAPGSTSSRSYTASRAGQHDAQERDQPRNVSGPNTQLASTLAQADSSDLVAPVRIPDDPHGILPSNHPAMSILGNSSLVIQRQLEMMNVMLGFEQANKYIIMDGTGQTLGYIAEQDHGIGRTMARQLFRTHRSFTTHIFDSQEREVLRIHRPFAYINSRIRIYDPIMVDGDKGLVHSTALQDTSASSVLNPSSAAQISSLSLDQMRVIGEAKQQWAPLRRKYDLFAFRPFEKHIIGTNGRSETNKQDQSAIEGQVPDQAIEAGMVQFAHVNEPFLSWDFSLRAESGQMIGSVSRNFAGFAREIFTDTGVYALRMDSAAQSAETETSSVRNNDPAAQMSLDQRAVMLATAVSIDFDYFSRHSHAGSGGFMPIWFPWGGGAAAEGAGAGAAGGAAAGEAGAVVGAAGTAGTVGAAGRGIAAGGIGDGAIAGAGTMAGYEAMQRGVYGQGSNNTSVPPSQSQDPQSTPSLEGEEIFDPDGQFSQSSAQVPKADDGQWWANENSNDDDNDPWGSGGPPSAGGSSSGDGSGEGGGSGGFLDSISDFFGDE